MELPIPSDKKLIAEIFGKSVIEQDFLMPDGKKLKYLLFESTPPAIVFPITHNEKVVVIKQFRYGANEIITEIPGGNPRGTEDIEGTAKRELMEEIGYSSEQLIKLTPKAWFDPATFRTYFIPFLALGCKKKDEQKLSESELISYEEIPLDLWINKILAGEISDAKTIAVTFLALSHLGYTFKKNKE